MSQALQPAEFDPGYRPMEEPIEEMVIGRQPRVGDWVNCYAPEPNGEDDVRRGDGPFLGWVVETNQNGCRVRIWSSERKRFVDQFFAPWPCICSRAAVSHYSLFSDPDEETNAAGLPLKRVPGQRALSGKRMRRAV